MCINPAVPGTGNVIFSVILEATSSMTTTVRRQIYAVLISALLLVIHLKEADSFTINSDGVRGFESHESLELFTSNQDRLQMVARPHTIAANNGQVILNHSDEHDDSLEFRSTAAVGQITGTPMTGTGGQITGASTVNVRHPVLFHSDEHDDFSDEVRSLGGILGPNNQVVSAQMTPNAGSLPSSGQRTAKHPNERLIVSAQPGKQVTIRTVTTPVNVQTTPMGKAILRHSDEHDDYSYEIMSKVSVWANPPVQNVPAPMASPAGLGQTTNPQHPIYRLRSGGHGDLSWREHDDDIHVQIDPITKQVVNVRTEYKDSVEHDDLFSDEVIKSRIVVSPTLTLTANPAQFNAVIQTPVNANGPLLPHYSLETAGRVLNQQNGQILPAVPGPAQPVIIGGHVIRHSDEVDDLSLEFHHLRSGIQTQTATAGGSTAARMPTGLEHLLRHSDEHDVSLEDMIGVHSLQPNVQNPGAPAQQGVRLFRDSDERDLSSEVVRRVLNQQHGQNLTALNQAVHLVNYSDEHDDTSVEIILNVRNGTAPGQSTLLLKHFDKVVGINRSPRIGQNPTAPAQQGVQFISRHSNEHDDSIEVVGLVRKAAVIPAETTVIGGHVIRHSDEIHDDSLELHHLGLQSPPANGPILTTPNVQQQFRHSHEDDVSLEDLIGVLNRPTNGQIQVAPVHQSVHLLRDSDEHDDLRERTARVLNHPGSKINTTVYLSRDSDEHDDLSLEVNFSLLPEIEQLFTDVRTDAVAVPAVQNQGVAAVAGTRGNQAFRNAKELELTFELEDILSNPLFQQKIQEIDNRLKSAPDARGKRLIEKYAEALALTSPSFNAAPAITKSSLYLPILFSCLLVWFS